MELTNPSVIRTLMEEAGITFRKEFGQNFLISRDTVERIADAAADDPDTVILEIGPGIGTLTHALAERYRKVIAIEIDRGLIPVLGKTLADCPNVTVIEGEAFALGSFQYAVDHNFCQIVTLTDDGAANASGSGSDLSFHRKNLFS